MHRQPLVSVHLKSPELTYTTFPVTHCGSGCINAELRKKLLWFMLTWFPLVNRVVQRGLVCLRSRASCEWISEERCVHVYVHCGEQAVGRKWSGNASQPEMDFKVQCCLTCIGTAVTMQAGVSLGSIYRTTRSSCMASCSTLSLPLIQSPGSTESSGLSLNRAQFWGLSWSLGSWHPRCIDTIVIDWQDSNFLSNHQHLWQKFNFLSESLWSRMQWDWWAQITAMWLRSHSLKFWQMLHPRNLLSRHSSAGQIFWNVLKCAK